MPIQRMKDNNVADFKEYAARREMAIYIQKCEARIDEAEKKHKSKQYYKPPLNAMKFPKGTFEARTVKVQMAVGMYQYNDLMRSAEPVDEILKGTLCLLNL